MTVQYSGIGGLCSVVRRSKASNASPSSSQKLSLEKVYHVVVAPCFDKKFEAVREEYYNNLLESRDVDCVLTSGLSLLKWPL